jgi:hypothetical protein
MDASKWIWTWGFNHQRRINHRSHANVSILDLLHKPDFLSHEMDVNPSWTPNNCDTLDNYCPQYTVFLAFQWHFNDISMASHAFEPKNGHVNNNDGFVPKPYKQKLCDFLSIQLRSVNGFCCGHLIDSSARKVCRGIFHCCSGIQGNNSE